MIKYFWQKTLLLTRIENPIKATTTDGTKCFVDAGINNIKSKHFCRHKWC